MRADSAYAREKFGTALSEMATSTKSLQDRLHAAYMAFRTVNASDLRDAKARSKLKEILKRLTAAKHDPDGRIVRIALDRMNDQEAQEIATLIFELYHHHLTD